MDKGRTALVAGATRGVGRAVAEELGRRGWRVVVTGRSSRAGARTEGLPGTVEDVAEAVDAAGGEGVPRLCDHRSPADVAALAEAVAAVGGLDLLVSNAWGGYEDYDAEAFVAPFWEQPLERRWQGMFEGGLWAHFLTCGVLAPTLFARRGLLVATVAWSFGEYLGCLPYDVAKAAVVRSVAGMARELDGTGVTALALAPGFTRTERVMAAHAAAPFDLSVTESPVYTARAVAALAHDPDVGRWRGRVVATGELAEEYGFTDTDGRRIPPFRLS